MRAEKAKAAQSSIGQAGGGLKPLLAHSLLLERRDGPGRIRVTDPEREGRAEERDGCRHEESHPVSSQVGLG